MARLGRAVPGIVLAAVAVIGGCGDDAENVGPTLRMIESDLSDIPPFGSAVLERSSLEAECLDPASGDEPFVVVVYELPAELEAAEVSEVFTYYEGQLTERGWELERRSRDSVKFSTVVNDEEVVAWVSVSPAAEEGPVTYYLLASLRRSTC